MVMQLGEWAHGFGSLSVQGGDGRLPVLKWPAATRQSGLLRQRRTALPDRATATIIKKLTTY
jgi:hypothetical protein